VVSRVPMDRQELRPQEGERLDLVLRRHRGTNLVDVERGALDLFRLVVPQNADGFRVARRLEVVDGDNVALARPYPNRDDARVVARRPEQELVGAKAQREAHATGQSSTVVKGSVTPH